MTDDEDYKRIVKTIRASDPPLGNKEWAALCKPYEWRFKMMCPKCKGEQEAAIKEIDNKLYYYCIKCNANDTAGESERNLL